MWKASGWDKVATLTNLCMYSAMSSTHWHRPPRGKNIYHSEIQNWHISWKIRLEGIQLPNCWLTFIRVDNILGTHCRLSCLPREPRVSGWRWSRMRLWLRILMDWGNRSEGWDNSLLRLVILSLKVAWVTIRRVRPNLKHHTWKGLLLNRPMSIFQGRAKFSKRYRRTNFTTSY